MIFRDDIARDGAGRNTCPQIDTDASEGIVDRVVGYLTRRLPVQRKAKSVQGIVSNSSLGTENEFNAWKSGMAGPVQVIQVFADYNSRGIFERIPAMISCVTALPAIVVEQ